MNIFKAIGIMLGSATNATVKALHAVETIAETVDEGAGIALDATKQMRKEQQAELASLEAELNKAAQGKPEETTDSHSESATSSPSDSSSAKPQAKS